MTFNSHHPDVDWVFDDVGIDWDQLSELYRVAPSGEKPPEALRTVFSNSCSNASPTPMAG